MESLLKSQPSLGERKGKLYSIDSIGSGQRLRGVPHCHIEFKKQLRPLVRLLQAKQSRPLTLKHLASLHTNIWEKPVRLKLLQPCSTSPTTPWQLGAGWCGRARALLRTCPAPASSMVEGQHTVQPGGSSAKPRIRLGITTS